MYMLRHCPQRLALLASLLAATILLLPGVARADNSSSDWGYFPLSGGSCGGASNGGVVVGAQLALQGNGEYLTSLIDGVYGQATYNAAAHYQSTHGLSNDGCVGTNTWRSLEGKLFCVSGGSCQETYDNGSYSYGGSFFFFNKSPCIWGSELPSNPSFSTAPGGSVSRGTIYRFVSGSLATTSYTSNFCNA